jgi:3-oxoacyl-[acyl-carrier-protein] synthase-3
MRAGITGLGVSLPDRVVTNADWVARLDTSDEWIVRRTGIRERHWLDDGAPLAPVAAEACRSALADAGCEAADVDRLIVTTITPDHVTPGLGPEIAAQIGAAGAAAMDLNAACAGFVHALELASGLIESRRAEVVLVCAAEALSRLTDVEDRGTAVLFGDGAGAMLLTAGEWPVGCLGFELGCDGEQAATLYASNDERLLRMDGQAVYRHGVARMAEATRGALERAGLEAADLDLFVAHQANARIIEAVGEQLGLRPEQVAVNIDRVANTSSASIPLALADAEREGRLRPGALVGMAAFGAGFVWGAGIVGWKEHALAAA